MASSGLVSNASTLETHQGRDANCLPRCRSQNLVPAIPMVKHPPATEHSSTCNEVEARTRSQIRSADQGPDPLSSQRRDGISDRLASRFSLLRRLVTSFKYPPC